MSSSKCDIMFGLYIFFVKSSTELYLLALLKVYMLFVYILIQNVCVSFFGLGFFEKLPGFIV